LLESDIFMHYVLLATSNSTFLSHQICTGHQPVSSIFLSQQISTNHQPQPAEQSDGDWTARVVLPLIFAGVGQVAFCDCLLCHTWLVGSDRALDFVATCRALSWSLTTFVACFPTGSPDELLASVRGHAGR
jgi:hypothetical protein